MSHQEGFAAVLNPVCAPEAGEAARTCSGWSTALIPRQSFPCRLSFRFPLPAGSLSRTLVTSAVGPLMRDFSSNSTSMPLT